MNYSLFVFHYIGFQTFCQMNKPDNEKSYLIDLSPETINHYIPERIVIMLRNKGLSEKVLLLGIDGMDPRFSKKMVDNGKMPNLKKLIEKGSARQDLRLLGAVPTITPPMWTTLATGSYPMTHGVEDFFISKEGELDICFSGFYSINNHSEPLWNVTAEAGKKTLVWHWPGGSWPPTSNSENLMVVDGTSAGALGFSYAMRDAEFIACASTKATELKRYANCLSSTEKFTGDPAELLGNIPFCATPVEKQEYHDEIWQELKNAVSVNGFVPKKYMDIRTGILMPETSQMDGLCELALAVSLSPIKEPTEWTVNIPSNAKEFAILFMHGYAQYPCLMLQDKNGKYNSVAIYKTKNSKEPIAVLEKDIYTPNLIDTVQKGSSEEMERIIRSMRLLDIHEDGSFLRIWISYGVAVDDNTVWYPHDIHEKIQKNVGLLVPTPMLSGGDLNLMFKCNIPQWAQAAKYQADSLNYMIKEENVKVIFSHFHGPDMSGHCYMKYLKNRENSPHPEEEFYKLHEATYIMTDNYIGEFLPLIDEGWTILLFSDHSLTCREGDWHDIADNYGINVGVMSELGYTVMKKDGNGNIVPEIDWEHTKAVQQRANSIYINLKGRDRYGCVDPADKYELEEQIITDLYGYKDKQTGKRIISLALHKKDANLLGLGGEHNSADIIFFVHDDYVFDHGEGLSTVLGHADTTLSPIFVAAGAGIKEGYEMKLFPREVDVAPTTAALLGVRMPQECEGAPIYSILSEEL